MQIDLSSKATLGTQFTQPKRKAAVQDTRPTSREIFAGMVGKLRSKPSADEATRARDVAEQYVAGALVVPMLKESREARDAAPPFGMTDAEKRLGSLMDGRIANDIVHKGNWGLVDRIARQLLEAGKKPQHTGAGVIA